MAIDEEDGAERDDTFSVCMGFAGVPCPGCGVISSAGPCPECGANVPAPEGLNEGTTVRREVLLPIRGNAEDMLAGFDRLSRGSIPITATAMLSGFVEAELFSGALEVAQIGRALEQFDLDDPEAVRGPVRELIEARLDAVAGTLAACRELAWFAPQPPGDELQGIAVELGRKAARLLVAFLAALTAVDMQAALDAEYEIQAELDGYAQGEAVSELLVRLGEAPSGVDARVGHALARPGVYTDAFGTVDLGRVFGAFSESGSAFSAVGRRAAQYFSFVLDAELSAEQETAASLLAIPLVGVVAAERPLIAHRLARMTYDLVHQAASIDRKAVADLVDETASESAQVLTAHARLRAAFVAIELSADGEPSRADDLLAAAADALGELVAVAWLQQARTLQKLDDIRTERISAEVELPLSAGDMHERLVTSRAPALREFAGALEAGALALGPVETRRTDGSVIERLEEASRRLLAGMAGVDAGYCLGIVGETLEARTPAWLEGGESVYATALLARILFGASGAELLEITPDGSHAIVEPLAVGTTLEPTRLLTAVAGLREIVAKTEQFSVTDPDGCVLVQVTANALRMAQEGPELTRDLALVSCFFDALVARGAAPEAAVLDLAATQLVVTILPALHMIDAPWEPSEYRCLAARINYVNRFVGRQHLRVKAARRLRDRLARASASASMAAHGDLAAANRLPPQLSGLGAWAMSHSKWPPI